MYCSDVLNTVRTLHEMDTVGYMTWAKLPQAMCAKETFSAGKMHADDAWYVWVTDVGRPSVDVTNSDTL